MADATGSGSPKVDLSASSKAAPDEGVIRKLFAIEGYIRLVPTPVPSSQETAYMVLS